LNNSSNSNNAENARSGFWRCAALEANACVRSDNKKEVFRQLAASIFVLEIQVVFSFSSSILAMAHTTNPPGGNEEMCEKRRKKSSRIFTSQKSVV
jgi:hypothetical protein